MRRADMASFVVEVSSFRTFIGRGVSSQIDRARNSGARRLLYLAAFDSGDASDLTFEEEYGMSIFRGHAVTSLAAAGFLAGLVMCAPAQAATAFSFSFTYGGGSDQTYTPSGPGTQLWSAISVTEGYNQFILSANSVSGPPAGAVSDVLVYHTSPVMIPAGMSGVLADTLQVTWDTYTFTSTSGSYTRDKTDNAVNFIWFGTFTDSNGILETQPARFSQSWSQASSNIQPSAGGTFFSMPVPESATWMMMLVGFAGIGFMARRSRSTKAMATA